MRLALLVILSGAAGALGHAPFYLTPVALAGFAGFIWCVAQRPTARGAAFTAWLGGTAYFMVVLHWIVEPFLVDAARHAWMAPIFLIALPGGLALLWGAAGAMAAFFGANVRHRAIALVVTLSAWELARGYILSGFPWALPSYVWIDTPIIQFSSVTGPYGLTFLTLGLVALPTLFVRWWIGALPVVALALLSFWDRASVVDDAPLGQVRLVQPNAPQDEKWDPEKAHMFVRRMIAATAAPKGDVDMIVWPETALPYRLDAAAPVLQRIAGDAEGVPVVLGINRSDAGRNYNAMIQLGATGAPVDIYDKVRLVPYGEFIPFGHVVALFGIRSFAAQDGYGFTSGAGLRPIETPLGTALPLICYEAVFPQHLNDIGVRPDYILQITNDAWFGNFSGPFQHFDQSRLRAIEQGLPVVRVANTGVSAVIDANGRVIESIGLNETGMRDVTVPGPRAATLYARTGDMPAFLLLAACLGGLWWGRRRNAIAKPAANG